MKKRVTLFLKNETYRKLRITAIDLGMSMSDVVEEWFSDIDSPQQLQPIPQQQLVKDIKVDKVVKGVPKIDRKHLDKNKSVLFE